MQPWPSGLLSDYRVADELLIPLYQDLSGPQLETAPYFIVGAQYALEL